MIDAQSEVLTAQTRACWRTRTVRTENHGGAEIVLDLRRLNAFVAVAEELHFRRAAKRLIMTQSPLSRIVKGLEQDLGFPLFIRNKRRVRLTAAGASLLTDSRLLIRFVQESVIRARSASTDDGQ